MPRLETASAAGGGMAWLDLNRVEQTQRASMWAHSARTFFPGLSVRMKNDPPKGSIRGMPFGSGRLWTILSPPLRVCYRPCELGSDYIQMFSVMLQLEGSTLAAQNRRTCRLGPQDFCLIDGRAPFDLEVTSGLSHIMFVQIPRFAVLSRHAYLEHKTAEAFDASDEGATLLRNLLLGILQAAPFLDSGQGSSALGAVTQLLGAPKLPSQAVSEVSWRARAALSYIDTHLADPGLTAERVARSQRISRRRLDEILLHTAGVSLTSQIWTRRLEQAATDLRDPRYASKTVTQIAFAVGFKNAAHFTRAFRRAYECTPCEWREGARADDEAFAELAE